MNVLALDLGNSALKGALIDADDGVRGAFRIAYDDLPEALDRALDGLSAKPDAIGLSSVVPAQTLRVTDVVRRRFAAPLVEVKAEMPWPFRVGYATPDTLGVDRLCAVAGAFERGAGPLVVVSAGTALTVEAVDASGTYVGGAIAPGPRLMARSLARGTAQLPEITVEPHPPAIGTTTAEALEAGIVGMYAEGARGLVRRTRDALGAPDAPVVATGGFASLLAAWDAAAFGDVRPHLVLVGIARIVQKTLSGPRP